MVALFYASICTTFKMSVSQIVNYLTVYVSLFNNLEPLKDSIRMPRNDDIILPLKDGIMLPPNDGMLLPLNDGIMLPT